MFELFKLFKNCIPGTWNYEILKENNYARAQSNQALENFRISNSQKLDYVHLPCGFGGI